MNSQVKKLTFTALMAAMITIFTAYICHIPVGQNGGYIHFGDSLIYIAACLLPWPYAMTAAAIGGGMADLLTAPIWAPATIIIKALISIPFTNKSDKIVTVRNVVSTIIAFAIPGSCIQSGGSAIIFVILGLVLDKIGFKRRFFTLEETK